MSSDHSTAAADQSAALVTSHARSSAGFGGLLIGSVGVVYGDIGTSPLYALREAAVAAAAGATLTADGLLGVLSLILWALIIVVTLKYVLILLRADNHGKAARWR